MLIEEEDQQQLNVPALQQKLITSQVKVEDTLETMPNKDEGGADGEDAGQPRQVSILKFFTFITFYDKFLLFIGTLSSILAGAILPSVSLIMGNVANAFTSGGGGDSGDIISNMSFIASYVFLIATSLFVCSYLFFAFW